MCTNICRLNKQYVLSCFSCVGLFVIPWTVAFQAPLSMGFSRQEYRSGLPFPPPGDLPDPGIEPKCPALTGGFFTTEPPEKPILLISFIFFFMKSGKSSTLFDSNYDEFI